MRGEGVSSRGGRLGWGKGIKGKKGTINGWGKGWKDTVASDVSMLVLGDGEEGGPAGEVLVVEVEVVVLGEGIEIGEVHVKEVLRAEGAEGCHCGGEIQSLILGEIRALGCRDGGCKVR